MSNPNDVVLVECGGAATARVRFGEEVDLSVAVGDIRTAIGNPDWLTVRERALAAENARLDAVQRPPIDGSGVGLDDIPEWAPPPAAYGTDGKPATYGLGVLVKRSVVYPGIVWRSEHPYNAWPPGESNLWRDVSSPYPAFNGAAPGMDLGIVCAHSAKLDGNGETVSRLWLNRRANNVWTPGTIDCGWIEIDDDPLPYLWIGGEGYPVDWRVTDGGFRWKALADGAGGGGWGPSVVSTGWYQEAAV